MIVPLEDKEKRDGTGENDGDAFIHSFNTPILLPGIFYS